MENYKRKLSVIIKLIFVFLLVEVFCGYFYFQRSWDKGIAINWVFSRASEHLGFQHKQRKTSLSKNEYRKLFHDWVLDVQKNGDTQIIVLYVPMINNRYKSSKFFFQELSKKEKITFIDTSLILKNFPASWVYNLPNDSHPSRLGHQLIAYSVVHSLKKISYLNLSTDIGANLSFHEMKGPHASSIDQVRKYNGLAYRVQTNNSGFRMLSSIHDDFDIAVMIIGDSFTFGTGVNTGETFPHFIQVMLKKSLIINAGVPAIGLVQELEIYRDGVQEAKPQIIILQVLDNDIE